MDKPIWPQTTETIQPSEGMDWPNPNNLYNPEYH